MQLRRKSDWRMLLELLEKRGLQCASAERFQLRNMQIQMEELARDPIRRAYVFGGGGRIESEERYGEVDNRAEFPGRVRDGEGQRRVQPPDRPAAGGLRGQGGAAESRDKDPMCRRQEVHEGEEDPHGTLEEAQVRPGQVAREVRAVHSGCAGETSGGRNLCPASQGQSLNADH
ncbi:hypothetical protein SAY86_019099 [Trapa natans]|uniref:Uncharacterized protein n=1 Tax=Trapa natans TaxID=22666 RepID=A0AAN7LPS1_TRANT|nr:hypothetical protein SAY86_019099 [Trapa natans]